MASPIVLNIFPIKNELNASPSTIISFDVVDSDGDLAQDKITIHINGVLAFDGNDFYSPFNSGSQIYNTVAGGFNGYHIDIDSSDLYKNIVRVIVKAEDIASNISYYYWGFIIQRKVNSLYFCDGYGLKKVDIKDLVGETQSSIMISKNPIFSMISTILSTTTIPPIPQNLISSIFCNFIGGSSYITLSYNDSYGSSVIMNESDINPYAVNQITYKSQINNEGTLYLINKVLNRIEVYYGAHFRNGSSRSPDFIYNSSSIPNIVPGNINDLHIVSGYSTKYDGGTRIYVGTTQGVTRIEAYDKGTNGYCDGFDDQGISIHYGIIGSGFQHELIGGTVSNVVRVSSDDDKGMMLVATKDEYNNGGLTQIILATNRKIFLTKSNHLIPSNNIRDIFGKFL